MSGSRRSSGTGYEKSSRTGKGILIHAVEKKRHSRLGSKGILAQDCTERRIFCKFIRIIIIEVTDNDLIDPLHKVLIVRMETEYSRVICLEVVPDDFFKTDAMCELLKEKQAVIRRKFTAIEIKFELLIETERGVIYNRHKDLSFMFDFDSTP